MPSWVLSYYILAITISVLNHIGYTGERNTQMMRDTIFLVTKKISAMEVVIFTKNITSGDSSINLAYQYFILSSFVFWEMAVMNYFLCFIIYESLPYFH